jgi:DNA repair exonuclease SbcCD ATPase subunit
MITFNKVRYRNFLSSGDNWTEIQLDRSSHTLIVGQNGAGKSTMLDAISFALFGKAHRNINKPQLVNSVNGKGMVAEIEFKVGAKEYKVIRGYKPVKFEIFVDGTLMNQNSHNKEYQKVLEQNILKLTHKTFHQVVVLGSSSFVPFMQLSALNRREVIEDLLDIGVFSKMNQILREKQAALREQTNHILHAIEINDTKQEAQKKYIRDISKINNDAKNQKETYIQETTQEVERLVKENFENQDLANAVSGEITPKITKANETLATLNSYESEFNTKIKSLVKDTKFYEKNDHCPTCDQDIGEELKSRKLGEAKAKAAELQSGSVKVQQEREAVLETLADLNEKQQQVQDLLQKVQINLQTVSTHNSNVDKARADIESLSDTHSDLSQANDDYDTLMAEYHELMETRNKQNDQSAYNTVISEMLKDSGIKTKIIKQYLPVINQLVNQYLQILDFYVHFDLDEKFEETIKSRHRDAFSYDSFSEGEKQRIDLGLLFSWRQVAKMKNSISTNLLILDETFDSSLDEAGIDNLMKIIHTLGDDTNVFIISHKGEMLDGKFESKIEFVKDKNFSKMKIAS